MTKTEFKNAVSRCVCLLVQETIDGCVECRALGGTCPDHHEFFCDLILHPDRYVRINEHGKAEVK